MKMLLTGMAGFIGFHLAKALREKNDVEVIGIDNMNTYYDTELKMDRLKELGFNKNDCKNWKTPVKVENLTFVKTDLTDKDYLNKLFEENEFDVVCNLAAQAGVRYSIEHPDSYISSNIDGFYNLLESCRHHKVGHLVFASSSSVYGQNGKIPFEETDRVDEPISLYAATKKSNELLAYCYSHLYEFPSTGLRFFTVYGPWGRPDMAYWLFTDAIYNDEPINVFNKGKMERDFTYIDDVISALIELILKPYTGSKPSTIYNIGNNKPENLEVFIDLLESKIGKKAKKNYVDMQPGDVPITYAGIDKIQKKIDYNPTTDLSTGLDSFLNWYKSYFNII